MTKGMTPLTGYQKRLFIFLGVATFFEGYDFIALAQLLPNLRHEFGLTEFEGGIMVGTINLGTVLAYFLLRKGDLWGRRKLMMVTIIGYTIFTGLSGVAPDAITFTIAQLFARIFLIAEWATSMVYAAEEYPADRRGSVLGVIQAFNALGAVICAGVVVPMALKHSALDWRIVYLFGIVPLGLLAIARRNLRETKRFEERRELASEERRSFFFIFTTRYRKRVLLLALIWGLTYICMQNAVTFWKEFAVAERGFTDGQVGLAIAIAGGCAMPLVFYAGRVLDVVGRLRGGAMIYGVGCTGIALCYTLHGQWPLTFALTLGIFGATAVMPVLNAFTTELFPTDLRSDAFAWSNNLLGRIGYVVPPFIIGWAAGVYGWGPTMTLTVVFPIIALVLILTLLPETRGLELEDTARL